MLNQYSFFNPIGCGDNFDKCTHSNYSWKCQHKQKKVTICYIWLLNCVCFSDFDHACRFTVILIFFYSFDDMYIFIAPRVAQMLTVVKQSEHHLHVNGH